VAESRLQVGQGKHLWRYWTKGAGLARWADAAHPWTALRDALLSEGVPADQADGLATNIFHHVTGTYPKHTKKAEDAMTTTVVGFTPITKAEKQDDGTLVVTGKIASSAVDRDYQIADPAWLAKSLGKWFAEEDGGNIREQHDGKRAVGTALTYKADDHEVSALIVDPITIKKIENRVLKGFSWSARNGKVQVDKAAAGGRIVAGDIYEVSVVDRPANPECLFTIAKADAGGELRVVEDPEFVEVDTTDKADITDVDVIEKADEPMFSPTQLAEILKAHGKATGAVAAGDIEKRDYSDKQRQKLADKGHALPDGSFPIANKADLANAIKAYGRAKDKAAAKKHIIQRARDLGAVDMLPQSWGVSKADGILTDLADLAPTIRKDDDPDVLADVGETEDISDGKAAIAAIARLIISEAQSLATGRLDELFDIQMLCEAASALRYFVDHEADETEYLVTPKADDATGTTTTEADATSATETETTAAKADTTIADAITKALKPLQDELTLVKGELAKVLETPQAGGPVRTRTNQQTATAVKAEGLRRDVAYLEQQIATTSGDMRKGYQQRLSDARHELSKLDGAA
jgi:hypothetical protein